MDTFCFGRDALCVGAAFVILNGCGGPSQVAQAGAAMVSDASAPTHLASGRSWMLPGTSSGDLIYAVGGCNGTCVLSYPTGKLVGNIATGGAAICSDAEGNIFIPEDSAVEEYAHGGTTPVATLSLPGGLAAGCGVDPNTNNLAVVFKGSGGVDGYGQSGNSALSELPNGASGFTSLSVSNAVGQPGQVQWDGKYMTYESTFDPKLSRLAISGSIATIVGTTHFKGLSSRIAQSWLYSGNIILPFNTNHFRSNNIGIWKYPRGGAPIKTIRHFGSYKKITLYFKGVTLSVQP